MQVVTPPFFLRRVKVVHSSAGTVTTARYVSHEVRGRGIMEISPLSHVVASGMNSVTVAVAVAVTVVIRPPPAPPLGPARPEVVLETMTWSKVQPTHEPGT